MKKIVMLMLLATTFYVGNAKPPKRALIMSDKTGWHKIGETTVDFTKDRDEILVQGADRFASIQFKVKDAPIHLMNLDVTFESGDNQKINVNNVIKAPGISRVIKLNGGERSIKKILFVYKTIPNYKDKKAHVEIWGLKTNLDKR